jgi:prepilin-type N-terminal cleavage/methylation domain-containing protein
MATLGEPRDHARVDHGRKTTEQEPQTADSWCYLLSPEQPAPLMGYGGDFVMPQYSKLKQGFTLIELFVVIAIIAVLDATLGQTVKLNVAFVPAVQLPGDNSTQPAQLCTVLLNIYDNTGKVVATGTETLIPNQSKSISFDNVAPNPNAAAGDPTAVEYHASVSIPVCPSDPSVSTTCSAHQRLLQQECLNHSYEFASNLELIDDGTGKTIVAQPGVSPELIGLLKGLLPKSE